MELDTKTGELIVNYGDRLVTLMREVRQLTGLGYAVPAKIQHVSNTAQKFYRHGCILKQVSYNLQQVKFFSMTNKSIMSSHIHLYVKEALLRQGSHKLWKS